MSDTEEQIGERKVKFKETQEERTYDQAEDEEKKNQREFFKAELERLKNSLRKEAKKIKKPKVREHFPYVFNDLEPYYNTYTAKFLIQMPDYGYEEKQPKGVKEMKEKRGKDDEDKELPFATRCTAIGLCDPNISLDMDKSLLPKLDTADIRRRRMEQIHSEPSTPRKSSDQKKPKEPKEGSTRLPKYPVVNLANPNLATKELVYSDVPMLREEVQKNYSHNGKERIKGDYTRTKQDFYRMELDRVEEYHNLSRDNMKAAYFAYLTNTPGSRKAIQECMAAIAEKKQQKVQEQQQQPQQQQQQQKQKRQHDQEEVEQQQRQKQQQKQQKRKTQQDQEEVDQQQPQKQQQKRKPQDQEEVDQQQPQKQQQQKSKPQDQEEVEPQQPQKQQQQQQKQKEQDDQEEVETSENKS